MDEDKKDPDRISEDTKKIIKTKEQDFFHGINEIKSNLERAEILKYKDIFDIHNKKIDWLFAIFVGTLLFILSNFDKFTISDDSMPHKYLYIISIILVGISSVLLGSHQMGSLWNQCNHYIIHNTVIMGNIDILQNLEKVDFQPNDGLSNEFKDKIKNLNNMVDELKKSNTKTISIICSTRIFIISMGFYLLGFAIFALYIIAFMICHM